MDRTNQELIAPARNRARLQFALADLRVIVTAVGITCATLQAKTLPSVLGTFLICLIFGRSVIARYYGTGWRGNAIGAAFAGLFFILVKRVLLGIDIVDIGWLFQAAMLCAVSGLVCSSAVHSIAGMTRWVNEDDR